MSLKKKLVKAGITIAKKLPDVKIVSIDQMAGDTILIEFNKPVTFKGKDYASTGWKIPLEQLADVFDMAKGKDDAQKS